jgi:hypothetical protein
MTGFTLLQVLFYPGFVVVIISKHILMYCNNGQKNYENLPMCCEFESLPLQW